MAQADGLAMSQAGKYFRRAGNRMMFYCPGCDHLHGIKVNGEGVTWDFNNNLEKPTFSPSVRHYVVNDGVEHTLCHYIITDGVINFCGDSHAHQLRGNVPLPELPERYRDKEESSYARPASK